MDIIICPICGKISNKKGIKSHIWRTHGEGQTFDPNRGYKDGTRVNGFLGKTHSIETKNKISNKLKGKTGTPHTEEFKKKISEIAKRNNFGGHTSKKAIHYNCKDGNTVYLQSNYEVQVAIDLDNNNINWIRPEPLNWVDKNGIEHRYYADFYLPDYNVYLDPKNDYLIKKDKIKIETVCNQNNVIIYILNSKQLSWTEIQKMLL